MEKIETICCAAGKSGGHIIPNLQWGKQYQAKILFFSANTLLDYKLVKDQVDIHIPLSIRIHAWHKAPFFLFQLFCCTIKSFFYLIKHKPSRIVSTGGITALPVCIAGYCLRIPIELFELNAIPGSATRWLAPLSTKIHVCFKSAKIYFNEKKVVISEYPIRFNKNDQSGKIFTDSGRTTIFIQGGSQGSVSLNKKVKQWIEDNPDLRNKINIIHQTGSYDAYNWKQFYASKNIPAHVFEFENNLAPYYHHADLIICRAGAGQLFEAIHFNKQCILIPLELNHNTHQLENALSIAHTYPELFTIVRQHESLTREIV